MNSHVLQYAVAGTIVVMLGGLAGWYVFVHRQIASTTATDSARGFSNDSSFNSLGDARGPGNTSSDTGSGSVTGSTSDSPNGYGVSGVSLPFNTFGGVNTGGTVSFSGTITGMSDSEGATSSVDGTARMAPRLWEAASNPTAGFGFAASGSRVFFAERGSGNILSADPLRTKITRLTNTLFPKTYEALFASDGSVVLRSLSDAGAITAFAGRIATSSQDSGAPATLSGVYLPQNIRSIAVRASSKQLFWLLPEGGSGVGGITSDWRGGAQKRVLTSALTNWRVWWMNDGKMYLLQSPADDVAGYAFRIGTTGTLQPLLGPVPGLTVLPRENSTALLYGSSAGGSLTLYAQASASSTAIALPIHTVADKCVWAPGTALIAYCAVPQTAFAGAFLRNWYEGALHIQDVWWKVDVSAGTAQILYRTDANTPLDVERPAIDPSGSYLAFLNGFDESLWMLKIHQ